MAIPKAICVNCLAIFPISHDEDEWIKNSEGQRVLCPDCYHGATGIDDFTDEFGPDTATELLERGPR